MIRTLTVTTPAASKQLLAIEEMRELAGVSGSGQDTKLEKLGLRLAADICMECNIAIGIGHPPTLLRETLTEVFRSVSVDTLTLSRRHDITITSVVVDGVTIDADDYLAEPESGLLHRLSDDHPIGWCATKITVVYDAGFSSVPEELARAAADFFRFQWNEGSRDPTVKAMRTEVFDVEEREVSYWAGSLPGTAGVQVPDFVAGQLGRFRNANV